MPTPLSPISLTRALRLDEPQPKPLLCFVGGGGKTTAMFALADELAAQGRRVVTTTTTRLFASQRDQSPAWCVAGDDEALLEHLDVWGQCLVVAERGDEGGKVQGVSVAQLAALHAHPEVDAVLVEADGSRRLPFKAPAPHEPVIPPAATHVVAMVGADVLGKALGGRTAHRPERVAALGGIPQGTPISPNLVARVLLDPAGGLPHVPTGAHFLPFLNRVETPADAMGADEVARLLLAHPRPRELLIGSLHRLRAARHLATDDRALTARDAGQARAALQRRSRAAAVVLAAGTASRFGQCKQLLPWQGTPLVARAAEAALELCETVLVVVGHEAEAVARAVEHLPVEVIFNERYREGQGSSVAAGASALLEAARPFHGECFFLVADQPLLDGALLRALRELRALRRVAVPRAEGAAGSPTLWDAALLPRLAQASGDAGGRVLFKELGDEIAWLELADPAPLRDVDTAEAWAALLAHME